MRILIQRDQSFISPLNSVTDKEENVIEKQ